MASHIRETYQNISNGRPQFHAVDVNQRRLIMFRQISEAAEKSRRVGVFSDFVSVVFEAEGDQASEELRRFLANENGGLDQLLTPVMSAALLFFDAFKNRERRFAAFAPRISERYWMDAMIHQKYGNSLANSAKLLSPPWSKVNGESIRVLTASLSCDLRKSTHCMDLAIDPEKFGEWLNQLVEILRAVCHLHLGVFDKFTGDGALVHFLERECQEIGGITAIQSAVRCAADMQLAIEHHMQKLRPQLRHDSGVFGAGIGIHLDKAYWGIDHRDNPIVVGKGVVEACRLCDGAKRGTVRLTNSAYYAYRSSEGGQSLKARNIPLVTKEYPIELKMLCWEFTVPFPTPELRIGHGLKKAREICERVCKGQPPLEFDDI